MKSIAKHHDHLAEIRRTLQLALPVMGGQVALFSMNFVDTVMAGRLPQKDLALAGLGIGGAIWSGLLVFTVGLLMALQPSIAQLDGAGRRQDAGAVARQGVWIALIMAVPFFTACYFSAPLLRAAGIDPEIVPVASAYLRAMSLGVPALCLIFALRFFAEGSGHTRPTLVYGVFGALLNIPLNYILMFGKFGMPALGTVGCGFATAIVLWLQLGLILWYIRQHVHFREFEFFRQFELPHSGRLAELLALGVPIAVTVSLESSMFVASSLLIGRLGSLPAAGHLVAMNFSALVFMVALGLSSAVTVRVGNAMGRGSLADARYAGLIGFAIVVVIQCVNMSLMLGFPELIVRIYTSDPAVIAMAASLLFYAAIFQLPDGLQICSAGALRGLKDTRVPMLFNLLAYWLIGISLGFYFTFERELGPAGMWLGMIAGLTVGASLMLLRFVKLTAPSRALVT